MTCLPKRHNMGILTALTQIDNELDGRLSSNPR